MGKACLRGTEGDAVIEHPDIGTIIPLDGKDTDGKPIRGFKVAIGRSGWLIYDEPAAREMHKMLAEMIAEWDAANSAEVRP